MRFIVLIVTVIGIATPAIGSQHDDEEETVILRAIARADSLLAQGQSDQALDEYVGVKSACLSYIGKRIDAHTYNSLANTSLLGGYREMAESLQKSLVKDPTQEPLFEILETVMLENIELYDRVALILDEIGRSDEAQEYREQVKDRRYFAEVLTTALEPLRKKSLEETMEMFPALRRLYEQ